jgi:hypothetical protein
MYFDIDKTLSHNCLFNIIIGPRGNGKTYSAKKRGIKNFIKKSEQFIYLRRRDSELQKVKKDLFADINLNQEFEHEVKFESNMYYYNEQVAGYAVPLSTAYQLKSASFPRVSFIIYDEFITDTDNTNYLKNEVQAFLDFYETINRMRETKVVFLANAVSFVNPYTVEWNLRLPKDSDIVKKNDMLLELVRNEAYIQKKKSTRFGKMIEGTKYGDYAINNKFLKDNDTFIGQKNGSAKYFFTFKYMDILYGVWLDFVLGKMWVSYDIDPTCKLIYSLTMDDHSENTVLVKSLNKSTCFQIFNNYYRQGNLYSENMKIKYVVNEVIKMLRY